MDKIAELVLQWRSMGPSAWAEGAYGWIDVDGQPVRLEPWQRAALLAWWERRETVTTLAVSNVKKTGKTFVNAVLLAWRWLALPGLHFAAANDLDQSMARQFAMIAEMVRRNPFLSENVRATNKELVFIPTGSTLQALASDSTGNAGANHLTASHTEAWGIQYEGAIRAYEELTPPPGRQYGLPALRIVDSYAGYQEESATWHDLVDRGLAGDRIKGKWSLYVDQGLLLFHMQGAEAQKACFRGSPAEAKQYYAEQRRSLRENSYKRLHENVRTANVGSFVDQEAWDALIDPELRQLPEGSKVPVYIGLDLAVAAKGDNCALIGVYGEGNRVKVAFHKVWKGAIRLKRLSLIDDVGPYIVRLSQKYRVAGVYFDPWQALALAELLREKGINCVEVPQTHKTRGDKDTWLYEAATNGRLVLYNDDELRYAPGGANAKELPDGRIFLQKAGGRSKIDLLVALSNCANEAAGRQDDWELVPDPFSDNPRPEGALWVPILHGHDFIWCWPGTDRHKAGVTAENHHFTKNWDGDSYACAACVRELENAGFYARHEDAARELGETMTEGEYQDWRYSLYHPWTPPPSQEEFQGKALFQHIKTIVRKGQAPNV